MKDRKVPLPSVDDDAELLMQGIAVSIMPRLGGYEPKYHALITDRPTPYPALRQMTR